MNATAPPVNSWPRGMALTIDQNPRQHARLAVELALRHLETGYQPHLFSDGKVEFILTALKTSTEGAAAGRHPLHPISCLVLNRCRYRRAARQTVACLSFFAHLCAMLDVCQSSVTAVLKFSFQLFTYKSFICVVNEINGLEFFFRYKWTNVSKNHFKTTEFCDFDQQQKMHQRAGCF
jgi:hypothetical protein